jgi:hypothetical protein
MEGLVETNEIHKLWNKYLDDLAKSYYENFMARENTKWADYLEFKKTQDIIKAKRLNPAEWFLDSLNRCDIHNAY